ncbi:MAG: hypothetical protein IKR73_01065, partial [Oscillospiraceae bacterium]|nr:hypothetical protein [Oscillospiraceae bacterium]
MNRIVPALLSVMLMLPLSACHTAPEAPVYEQPADGEKLTDEAVLSMFEINGTRLYFPVTLSDITYVEGVTTRRMFNIDYPDDIDITVRIYFEDTLIGYALHDKDGNVSDITFLDDDENGIVHVNGFRLSDDVSLKKLFLPMIDAETGEYRSLTSSFKLIYARNRISLSMGNKEHKTYAGNVAMDQGALPPSWD